MKHATIAIVLAATLALVGCDLSKSQEDTFIPPGTSTPLVVPSVRSLGDGASIALTVTVYGGQAPYLGLVAWGDGSSTSIQGATFPELVHVYEHCGVDGGSATGWLGTVQATDIDGRSSAAADFKATPCL